MVEMLQLMSGFVNGSSVSTDAIYSASNFVDGDELTCVVTSNYFCVNQATSTSEVTTISIVSDVVPTVEVALTQGASTICAGELVEFSTTAANEGDTPTYEWFLNGSPVSTDAIYSTTALANQDVVYCEMTSSDACASNPVAVSETFEMIVNPLSDDPTAEVAITIGAQTICEGENVEFAATVANEGTTPVYEWFLNGNAVSNTATYASSTLADADAITVNVTTSNACVVNPSILSSALEMTVNPIPTQPTITQVDFTLTSSAAAGNQWMLAGNDIPGATGQNHIALENGIYSVRVSNNDCVSENAIDQEVTGLGITDLSNAGFSVAPNPSKGVFNVNMTNISNAKVDVYNVLGALVYSTSIDSSSNAINLSQFTNGVYVLKLQTEVGTFSTRLVKN